MFCKKKILAIIPARGGSKGVPGKNIKFVGGKPLIAWMIEAAKGSKYIDRLILSSDDQKIISTAKIYGCEAPFIRPPELARDDSSSTEVVIHALNEVPGYDYVMLLQPTSPLTSKEDIDGCIDVCISSSSDATVSVTKPDKSPYWMFNLGEGNELKPLFDKKYLNKNRQQLPAVYMPSGAVYIANILCFLKNKSFYSSSTTGYVIPQERSLDIDSESDFVLLNFLIEKLNR